MRRILLALLAFTAMGNLRAAGQGILHAQRSSAGDLEVAGELKGRDMRLRGRIAFDATTWGRRGNL